MLIGLKGLRLLKKRNFSNAEGLAFVNQLAAYKAGSAPFNAHCGGPGFNVRNWWAALMCEATRVLCVLAMLLCDFVPHAAANERAFSTMGKLHSGKWDISSALHYVIAAPLMFKLI